MKEPFPIHNYIEQTFLKPSIRAIDVERLVQEAKEHQFVGICVPPYWVKKAKRDLENIDCHLVTVIGFPLAYQRTEAKLEEAKLAIQDGADELDMVMNLSAFRENTHWAKVEIVRMTKLIHEHEKILKVIIETAYLTKEEVITASKICAEAGADFVKTSTGFAPTGAKIDDIKLIKSVLPAHVGIKASGGIKTKEQALAMIEAGADRIGSSSGVQIIAV